MQNNWQPLDGFRWALYQPGQVLAAVIHAPSTGSLWHWKARPVLTAAARLAWETEGIAADAADARRKAENFLGLVPQPDLLVSGGKGKRT